MCSLFGINAIRKALTTRFKGVLVGHVPLKGLSIGVASWLLGLWLYKVGAFVQHIRYYGHKKCHLQGCKWHFKRITTKNT